MQPQLATIIAAEVTNRSPLASAGDYAGASCLAHYTIRLQVGERTIELPAFKVCSWSRRGTWRSQAEWGVVSGTPVVELVDGDPDRIRIFTHLPDEPPIVITTQDVPELGDRALAGFVHSRLVAEIDIAAFGYEPGEPDAEEVFGDLTGDGPVRIGNWKGAGIVLAWRASDGWCYFIARPDSGDIERTLSRLGIFDQEVRDDLVCTLEQLMNDEE